MKECKTLNGNQLRLIAVISMILDHAGVLLKDSGTAYKILHACGRIAFPVFVLLLLEGYLHTGNWRRYAMKLLLLAAGSEILFDSVLNGVWGMDWSCQGTVFTLLLGLIMMKVMGNYPDMQAAQFSIAAAACVCSMVLHLDYDYDGILLIAILYWYRTDWKKACLIGGIWMALNSGSVLYAAGYGIAFYLLYHYNGEKGKISIPKWVTYSIYPLHLAVIWMAARILL